MTKSCELPATPSVLTPASPDARTFGLVGYSTRALARAAIDLGFKICAVDAFGDQDLRDLGPVVLAEEWPIKISSVAERVSVDAWLLAGGMENCSSELLTLSKLAPVLGPGPAQLQLLRSLEFWESLCDQAIRWPHSSSSEPQSEHADWLRKRRHSSAGLGVQSAALCTANGAIDDKAHDGDCYWQRRLDGRTLGATWICHQQNAHLLGVTQALGPSNWPGPTEFIYRGSFGPIELASDHLRSLEQFGQWLAQALPDYRGYIQADLIEDSAQQLWLLEINPRWTASMELLHEAAASASDSPLAKHLRTWGINLPAGVPWNASRHIMFSKAVYYAPQALELTQATRRKLYSLRNWQPWPDSSAQWCLADLPATDEADPMRYPSGCPIMTVKCRGGVNVVPPQFLSELIGQVAGVHLQA